MSEKIAPPSEKSKKEDLFDTTAELFGKTIDKLFQNTSFRDSLVRNYLHLDPPSRVVGILFEGKDGKYSVMVDFFSRIEKSIELNKLEDDLSVKEHFYLRLNYHPTDGTKWHSLIRYQNRLEKNPEYIFNEEVISKFREVLEKI